MKSESNIRGLAWRHGWLVLALFAFVTLTAFARAEPDEEEVEGPFHPLFNEDPDLKRLHLIPANGYYQVSTALTANPESGYRWDLWAIRPDGKPIGRMAPSGKIASRRLIDLTTNETIGVIDCTKAPAEVTFHNRHGRRINIDLCLAWPGETDIKPPYPLYRVERRDRNGLPIDVDPDPIGWIDELQGMLLDDKESGVARFETVRLSENGSRTQQHDFIFEGRSLSTELLSGPPSNDLLRRIEERGAALKGTNDLPSKLLRIELAARWLHVGAALAKDKNASILLPPERIAGVRRALAAAPLNELNELWREPTRQLIWDVLAAANPHYQLYAEGAALASLRDDPAVLDHALRLLKAVWIKNGRQQIKVKRQGPIEDWMRTGLGDSILFQSVRTPEDALSFVADYKLVQPSTLMRARAMGEPPVIAAHSPAVLRATNQASAMDRAIHLAAALQRGGRDVTLWSLSIEKIVDDSTKTKVQEGLILFPKLVGKPEVLAIGGDYFLEPLKGKKIAAGYYEFPAMSVLQPLLIRSAQFQVPMIGVLSAQSSLSAWIDDVQKSLTPVRMDDPNLTSILLETADANSWQRYNTAAAESLATLAQSRFVHMVRENKIAMRIERVVDGKIASSSLVKDVDSRPADQILAKHEATLGRCLHMLPPKFEERFRFVTLRSEPTLEPLTAVTIEDGKIKVDTKDRTVIGRAGGDGLMLAGPHFPQALHELMHRWGNSRSEIFTVGDWKGTLIDPFNEISWERANREAGWERRTDTFKIEDFWWEYGATNEREDFAVIGQFYGSLPGPTRARVRSELKKGNFLPAAKYLYFKSIAFLDADGRSLEIDVDLADRPFTIAEFEKEVRAQVKKGSLNEEQERLRDLVSRIKTLNAELKEKK